MILLDVLNDYFLRFISLKYTDYKYIDYAKIE